MQLFTWLMVLAAAVAAYRVYIAVRRLRAQKAEDWDEHLVKNLRAQGNDPFRPSDVDFFFELPDQRSCEQVSEQLGTRGFKVDFRRIDPERGEGFTLHALASMRISVPEMQKLRHELTGLAMSHGGRYDGWATAGITRAAAR
jgi:hypothetical protein